MAPNKGQRRLNGSKIFLTINTSRQPATLQPIYFSSLLIRTFRWIQQIGSELRHFDKFFGIVVRKFRASYFCGVSVHARSTLIRSWTKGFISRINMVVDWIFRWVNSLIIEKWIANSKCNFRIWGILFCKATLACWHPILHAHIRLQRLSKKREI